MDEKVRIRINDSHRYAEVAWLVDQRRFLKEIALLRIRIKLKRIIPYVQFDISKKFFCNPNKKQREELCNLKERLELLESHNWKGVNDEEIKTAEGRIKEINNAELNFQKSIEEILNLYGKSNDYKNVVLRALICKEVRDQDLKIPSHFAFIKHIRRNRKWYWMYREYKKYSLVVKMDKKHKDLVIRSVISAINKYKSFLSCEENK